LRGFGGGECFCSAHQPLVRKPICTSFLLPPEIADILLLYLDRFKLCSESVFSQRLCQNLRASTTLLIYKFSDFFFFQVKDYSDLHSFLFSFERLFVHSSLGSNVNSCHEIVLSMLRARRPPMHNNGACV